MNATLSQFAAPPDAFEPLFPALAGPEVAAGPDITDIKEWCVARADEWYARGEHGAARDFLKHAASVDPTDAQVWLALGSLQYKLDELENAGHSFHQAGALAPMDTQVFLHLGVVHQQLKNDEEAEALFKHSLKLDPNNHLALGLLGGFLMAQERFNEARPYFAESLQRNPADIETLMRLGVCCFRANNFDVSRTCFERVLNLAPDHELAAENLRAIAMFSHSASCLK